MNDFEIEIKGKENEEYDMSEDDFIAFVKDEIKQYLPKLKRFAKNHTKDECIEKTGEWWDDYRISDATERALDKYVNDVLFA